MLTSMFVCLGIFSIIYVAILLKRLSISSLERRILIIEEKK